MKLLSLMSDNSKIIKIVLKGKVTAGILLIKKSAG